MTRYFAVTLLGACLIVPLAGQAQTTPDAALLACRGIEKKGDRLACFDRALDSAFGVDKVAEKKRETLQRDNFGDLAAEEGDTAETITATITHVEFNQKYGDLRFQLDNGSVWKATTQGGLRNGFEPGTVVHIEKGVLGSYKLTMDGRSGFRGVKRVQ